MKSPNHALQRTGAAVTPAASTAAFPPATQRSRQPRRSLSLRSLGDSAYFTSNVMINKTLILIAALASILVFPLHAQSDALRELKRLQDQREAALDAAAEPINRKFGEALEPLLRRAIQTSDLEAATKIKLAQHAVTLANGLWTLRTDGGYVGTRRFNHDGSWIGEDGGKGYWSIEGDKLVLKNSNGVLDTLSIPGTDNRARGKNDKGAGLTLSKQK